MEALLRDRSDAVRISALNAGEVLDVLVRHRSIPAEDVRERLSWLGLGGLEVVPVVEAVGLTAGELHARHYDRSARPVSLADCVALATALRLSDRLATSDPPLAQIARAQGCEVIALPDVRGRRP